MWNSQQKKIQRLLMCWNYQKETITIIKILNAVVEKMDGVHEKIRKSNGNGRNGKHKIKNKI